MWDLAIPLVLSLPPFPEVGREAHQGVENATGGGWHVFLLQTHSPLQLWAQFTYECCGVLHKQELREQKGAESEGKGKGKKPRQKLEVVTGTQRQGYCSELFSVVPADMRSKGIISERCVSPCFTPVLPGPVIRSALISDTSFWGGHCRLSFLNPRRTSLSAAALPPVC